MAVAHINIGTNLGDRRAHIDTAVGLIEAELGTTARRATLIESAPWGYDSPNAYLNLGIAVEAGSTDPAELLQRLLRVQRAIDPTPHRKTDGTYADRIIDIDLIALGQMTADTPELTLPHPRMHLREFVLRPVAELEPSWRHPRLGLTAAELLRRLGV